MSDTQNTTPAPQAPHGTAQPKPKFKKFFILQEEMEELAPRNEVKKFLSTLLSMLPYLKSIVERDMTLVFNETARKRLHLSDKITPQIFLDEGYFLIPDEPPMVAQPNSEVKQPAPAREQPNAAASQSPAQPVAKPV